MNSVIRLCLLLLGLFSGLTGAAQNVDLEAVMKNIGHQYKLAVKAPDAEQMQSALEQMSELVHEAKIAKFHNEPQKSLQGLDKVLEQIASAQSFVEQGDTAKAKQALKEIDSLRKQYHELHEPPGFWELLFGS